MDLLNAPFNLKFTLLWGKSDANKRQLCSTLIITPCHDRQLAFAVRTTLSQSFGQIVNKEIDSL